MKQLALAAILLSSFIIGHWAQAEQPRRVLIVVGPSSHPPGSHEVAAGGRLIQHCLANMANVSGVKADITYGWPTDPALLDAASSVVFMGDTFPPQRLPETQQILARLDAMMQRGCGIVCVHYATGLWGQDVAPDGAHPLLGWLGGYFANKTCPHHQGIAAIYPAATITPAALDHPIARGWKEFTLHDEPYINNYFGKNGNQLASHVTALATSLLPPDAPQRETVAWCVERPDGGRGFGIVMPHFYENWAHEDLRKLILNGIVWTAKVDVPADGVQTPPPNLRQFQPQSVHFVPSTPAEDTDPSRLLVPLPETPAAPAGNPATPEKVALGKQLFFDPRLSGDNRMSCATCHLPENAFCEQLALAKGDGGKTLARNTQTVLNAGFYERYFWDGRALSLEEQALVPIQSPDEMHQDLAELEQELNAVDGYVAQFQRVFATPVTRQAIAQSLAAFQRTLVTGPSPLDRYLQGDKTALSAEAQQGLALFTGSANCVRCHHGPLLSDGQFYRLGVSSQDEGWAAVTGNPDDRHKIRTPSLRNIAETSPYMHDGSLRSLTDVVEFYYRGVPATTSDGLPLDVKPLNGQSFTEIPALVAFLESLTGETPRIEPPELP